MCPVKLDFWSTPSGTQENQSSASSPKIPMLPPLKAACLLTTVLKRAEAPEILITHVLRSPHLPTRGLSQLHLPLWASVSSSVNQGSC